MRLFLASLLLALKKLARERAFLVCLLLLPAAIFVCAWLLAGESPLVAVRVAVVMDREDSAANSVWGSLPEHNAILWEQYSTNDREEVEAMVRTGELECAYVLGPQLQTALDTGVWGGAVTLLRSPSTVADAMLSELVFDAVLRQAAPGITTGHILEIFPEERVPLLQEVTETMEWYGRTLTYTQQEASYINELIEAQPEISIAARPLHGVIALFLLSMLLFVVPAYQSYRSPGIWSRLGFGGLCRYYSGVFSALWLASTAAGTAALGVLRYIYPAAVGVLRQEVAMLAAYTAALSMLAVLAVILLPAPDLVYAGGILVLLVHLVLGGVLVDWGEISLSLQAVSRWTITDQYIAGALYGGRHLRSLLLIAVGAALAVAARLAVYARRGKM